MTKFINLTKKEVKTTEKTVFKKYLTESFSVGEASAGPESWENVAFIGNDALYGDVFKCWNKNENDFILYFGTKGDEFNS